MPGVYRRLLAFMGHAFGVGAIHQTIVRDRVPQTLRHDLHEDIAVCLLNLGRFFHMLRGLLGRNMPMHRRMRAGDLRLRRGNV